MSEPTQAQTWSPGLNALLAAIGQRHPYKRHRHVPSRRRQIDRVEKDIRKTHGKNLEKHVKLARDAACPKVVELKQVVESDLAGGAREEGSDVVARGGAMGKRVGRGAIRHPRLRRGQRDAERAARSRRAYRISLAPRGNARRPCVRRRRLLRRRAAPRRHRSKPRCVRRASA